MSHNTKNFGGNSHVASHEAERCEGRRTPLWVDLRHEVALEALRRHERCVLAHRVERATFASALLKLLGLHLRVDREALRELWTALINEVHGDDLLLDVGDDDGVAAMMGERGEREG